jgi:histone H3/H4
MDQDRTDYTFMNTGQNMSGVERMSDSEKIELTALITVFLEKSITSAFQYVEHSNRNGVTTEDIKSAMKLEVFRFLHRENIHEDVQRVTKELSDDFFGLDTSEETNEEMSDDDFVFDSFCMSLCSCTECRNTNLVVSKWNDWVPSNYMESSLKMYIDALGVDNT